MEKQCACKGIRTCLLCETVSTSDHPESYTVSSHKESDTKVWYYCTECSSYAHSSLNHELHSQKDASRVHIPGVYVQKNFISEAEETQICSAIDQHPWVDSQSGRRKQDFGPKVNFKKHKIRLDVFRGFPSYSQLIMDKMKDVPVLSDFQPVEMCNLDYVPEKGAAIDPHFDDFWLWGERLLTINLLSETIYTLTLPKSHNCKSVYKNYEEKDIRTFEDPTKHTQNASSQSLDDEIQIILPRRCLVVLYDDARFTWHHSIKREHITERRIGINIRELTPLFLNGGDQEQLGKCLLEKARVNPEEFVV